MLVERHALFWLATALLFAYLVQLLAPVLLPFVIGLTLAYFLTPIVDALSRFAIPRWVSSLLVVAGALLLVGIALLFLVPILLQQLADFVEAMPRQIERVKILIETNARDYFGARYPQAEATVRSAVDAATSAFPALLAGVARSVWNQGSAAFNFVAVLLITPVVFFYALKDWPKLVANVDSWLPRDSADELRSVAREINRRVSAFIRGQGVVCILLAVYYASLLSISGLQYGLLVGLCTGLASFIPAVGWTLGTVMAVGLALVQYWPEITPILIVIAIMLGGQALESAILTPNIIGSEIELHPVWLIFALMTFGYLFGFLGLLVAVPVSAAIGVLVRYALHTYLASSVYRGENSVAV